MGDTKKTLADYPNLTDEKIKALTPEERREAGRLGGIASGKVRKKKKTMRAIYESLANQKVNGETVQKLQGTLKKVKKDLTVEESIVLAQVLMAQAGDTRAAEFLRDTAGEKPVEKVQIAEVDPEVIDEVEGLINDES
jgi:alkylhydroperoxidase/carboxymuconolactone decarboxylase family protein YurZ